jgi:hypothetical protein
MDMDPIKRDGPTLLAARVPAAETIRASVRSERKLVNGCQTFASQRQGARGSASPRAPYPQARHQCITPGVIRVQILIDSGSKPVETFGKVGPRGVCSKVQIRVASHAWR